MDDATSPVTWTTASLLLDGIPSRLADWPAVVVDLSVLFSQPIPRAFVMETIRLMPLLAGRYRDVRFSSVVFCYEEGL